MGNLREENVMKGKRIVTIYYVIVLALGITSLILIRPEKPPEPLCNFKFNYQGEKFEPTDKLQYLSAHNYFKVNIDDLELMGFLLLDAKSKCTPEDFFIAVSEEAQKVGANWIHLTHVERHLVTQTYGWAIGGAALTDSKSMIDKRFIYSFVLYRNKEVPEWQKESGN